MDQLRQSCTSVVLRSRLPIRPSVISPILSTKSRFDHPTRNSAMDDSRRRDARHRFSHPNGSDARRDQGHFGCAYDTADMFAYLKTTKNFPLASCRAGTSATITFCSTSRARDVFRARPDAVAERVRKIPAARLCARSAPINRLQRLHVDSEVGMSLPYRHDMLAELRGDGKQLTAAHAGDPRRSATRGERRGQRRVARELDRRSRKTDMVPVRGYPATSFGSD